MMAPVLTFCWSVNIHVETQVCADPTLLTASRSGKLLKSAWSVTQDLTPRHREASEVLSKMWKMSLCFGLLHACVDRPQEVLQLPEA